MFSAIQLVLSRQTIDLTASRTVRAALPTRQTALQIQAVSQFRQNRPTHSRSATAGRKRLVWFGGRLGESGPSNLVQSELSLRGRHLRWCIPCGTHPTARSALLQSSEEVTSTCKGRELAVASDEAIAYFPVVRSTSQRHRVPR